MSESRREVRSDSLAPVGTGEAERQVRSCSPDPLGSPAEAVQDLVERVARRHGGAKALAGVVPVGYAQIRRWVGDGSLPGLDDVLLLVRLAGPRDPFRPALIEHLQRMFDPTPEQIAASVTARVEAGAPLVDALRDALVVAEVKPGVWVRVP